MKFELKMDGDLRFMVFGVMSNENIKHAIEQEIILQSVILSHKQQNALKTYLNTLENDYLFIDTDEEMELSFGFSK